MSTLSQRKPTSRISSKPLVGQLAQVCREIQGLTKIGDNGAYKYLRIVDIAESLRNRLFDRGILLIPNDVECHCRLLRTNVPNRFITEARVKTEFTLTDGKREKIFASVGAAQDWDGFAVAIAQTAALKSWLKRIGLMFGDQDDPEIVESKPNPAIAETPHQLSRQAAYQQRAWTAALATCGKTAAQIESFLTTEFGFEVTSGSITSLSPEQFDIAMKFLSQSDLEKTLEVSARAIANRKPQPIVQILDNGDRHVNE